MTNKKIGLLAACSTLLAACGGNDRAIDIEPTLSCDSTEGAVFIDASCPPWQAPSVFEQDKVELNSYEEVPLGVTGQLVEQQILNAEDPARGQVWDIRYGDNTQLNGLPRIAPEGVLRMDLSEYATGTLTFDLRIIDLGESQQGLWTKMECGWPCTTNARPLPIGTIGQWQSHEISVAEMIADGLDITKVAMGFQIFPTWNEQTGAHFQLDNIRWSKGVTTATEKCFAQHFDQGYTFELKPDSLVEDDVTLAQWLDGIPEIKVNPQWDQVASEWSFAAKGAGDELIPNACASRGTLSASVYLPESYVADGNMAIGLFLQNQNGILSYEFDPISVATLNANAWNILSVDLSLYNDIPSDVGFVGVYFNAGDKPVEVGGEIMLDNFLITHP